MNRPSYCPVNSSTQVTGQFPSQAYLFVYIISKAWGMSASLWRPSIQVVGHQDMKQGVHWPADFINHTYNISFLQENLWRSSSGFKDQDDADLFCCDKVS